MYFCNVQKSIQYEISLLRCRARNSYCSQQDFICARVDIGLEKANLAQNTLKKQTIMQKMLNTNLDLIP